MDRYVVRLIHFIVHTVHGSGVVLPTTFRLPTYEELKSIFSSLSLSGLWNALPESLSRLHIDWIFTSNENVLMCFIEELRDEEFSSDHFPLVTLVKLY